MTDEEEALAANAAFYAAFAASDAGRMDAVWARRAPVACVHPGWEVLTGRDLANLLNVADKVFDRASFWPGEAVEHSDFVRWSVEQFAHDPLTDFTDPAGDENLHYADLPTLQIW